MSACFDLAAADQAAAATATSGMTWETDWSREFPSLTTLNLPAWGSYTVDIAESSADPIAEPNGANPWGLYHPAAGSGLDQADVSSRPSSSSHHGSTKSRVSVEPYQLTRRKHSTPSTKTPSGGHMDTQCVLAATQIINALESSLTLSQTVDVVLKIVHQAGVGLNGLVCLQLQQHKANHRCLALFKVILSQNVQLLETTLGSLGLKKSSQTTPSSPPSQGETLEQLELINQLIAGFESGTQPKLFYDAVWAQRFVEELDFCLDTVSRVAGLIALTRAAEQTSRREFGGETSIETIKNRLEQLGIIARPHM
ncbi:Uu.00g093350.m01.CDS01 [Anthostomella pinea]|uniref:Uu.00g093350.m01.CDS01 n=1 Tax=Anthostomella pinea TaxID=933095 RepID=A0AAI8VNH6_9PEZI|nr:Uu.00g093350.m01.CDS01 [Anthostomella pinea]